jgi:hypothetical protein
VQLKGGPCTAAMIRLRTAFYKTFALLIVAIAC